MTGDRKVTLYNNKSKVVWTIPFSDGFLGFEKLEEGGDFQIKPSLDCEQTLNLKNELKLGLEITRSVFYTLNHLKEIVICLEHGFF